MVEKHLYICKKQVVIFVSATCPFFFTKSEDFDKIEIVTDIFRDLGGFGL